MGTQQLGKYLLKRKLATGGMAEIWLAEQQGPAGFAKTLVIKRILPHLADDRKFVEMFLDEARLAAKLEHPNIVRISDLGHIDGAYFIAMEYIDGPDLDYIIERAAQIGTQVPLHIAARIIADALAGLEHAHTFVDENGVGMGLVHRDISPHNVLINKAGVSKIVDFGVAKAASSTHKTQTGAIKGKFAYMSPEQIANNDLDGRSDVFAMGIVLYELTTNKRPFGDEGDLMAVTAILTKPPINPRELVGTYPPEMEQIIMKSLAKNRDQRYGSAAEMQADLEKFIFSMGQFITQKDVARYLKDLFSDSPSMLGGQPGPALPSRFDGGDAYLPSFSTGTGHQPAIQEGQQGSGHQPAMTPGHGSGHQPAMTPGTGHQTAMPPRPVPAPAPPPPTQPSTSGGGGGLGKGFLVLGIVGLLAFIVIAGGLALIFISDDNGGGKGDTSGTSETTTKAATSGEKKDDAKKDAKTEPKKPKKKTGKIAIQSTIPATVTFEDPPKAYKGKKKCDPEKPCLFTVPEGEYTFKLVSAKNLEKKVKVAVKAKELVEKTVKSGTLELEVVPESKDYFVKIAQRESPDVLKGPVVLYEGKYKVLVRNMKTGKYDDKEVEIKPGEKTTAEFKIE